MLPSKPSALIRLALSDLRKCELDPEFSIDMDVWADREDDGTCTVCLAGAVLMQTIGFKPPPGFTTYLSDLRLSDEDHSKICALDQFRKGNTACGLVTLGLLNEEGLDLNEWDHDVDDYREPNSTFHEDMEYMASNLESLGL